MSREGATPPPPTAGEKEGAAPSPSTTGGGVPQRVYQQRTHEQRSSERISRDPIQYQNLKRESREPLQHQPLKRTSRDLQQQHRDPLHDHESPTTRRIEQHQESPSTRRAPPSSSTRKAPAPREPQHQIENPTTRPSGAHEQRTQAPPQRPLAAALPGREGQATSGSIPRA